MGWTENFLNTLEEGVAELPQQLQASMYRRCAANCMESYVLQEQRKEFEACGGDMDRIYTEYGPTEYNFRSVIEPGRVYEFGYPRCLCPLGTDGVSTNAVHCECSRQSILYVLEKLLPDQKFEVETIETVLGGGNCCRFRITRL